MHLVRNALDHGIETPEERRAAGNDELGVISITCKRETKHIELTVSDDGRGIDFEKIRAKASRLYVERADEIKDMGEKELSQFLFMSGFSTKDKVTELSGRGVGLDVVWTNVEKIKGRVRLESTFGKGTSFILHFPLSLSTLQGLFVMSNQDKFLIPSQHIVDVIYRKKSEYVTLQNQTYIKFEGQLVPVFSLSTLFKDHKGGSITDADSILIAEYMEQRIGIVVEQVFSVPGLGRLLVASISNRDYPVVQAIVVILAFWVVLAGTVADLINQRIDPRLRLGGSK